MRMIPDFIGPSTESGAERRLFGHLREVSPADAFCFHSLRLSRHEYKVAAEIDFAFVTRLGVLVMEVKGGGVAQREGVWEFTDRFGVAHRSVEGPLNQADSAMRSLMAMLRDEIPQRDLRTIPFGWCVAFPDCEFDVSSVEWDPLLVVDHRRLAGGPGVVHQLSSAIDQVQKHGAARDRGMRVL